MDVCAAALICLANKIDEADMSTACFSLKWNLAQLAGWLGVSQGQVFPLGRGTFTTHQPVGWCCLTLGCEITHFHLIPIFWGFDGGGGWLACQLPLVDGWPDGWECVTAFIFFFFLDGWLAFFILCSLILLALPI
uniref:Uncharacterized protein n=1 Tax=Ditylenchus dipsaci TaxID=166011 RepID=A0A915EA59_9BILA